MLHDLFSEFAFQPPHFSDSSLFFSYFFLFSVEFGGVGWSTNEVAHQIEGALIGSLGLINEKVMRTTFGKTTFLDLCASILAIRYPVQITPSNIECGILRIV